MTQRSCLRFFDRILQKAIKSAHPIFPSDFLAFFVSAPPVADPHFINAQIAPRHFHRNFRLESETILFNRNGLNHLAPENLVTRSPCPKD